MHGFHLIVSNLCVKDVRDTQCGFKLFDRTAAKIVFAPLHIERWAFDVELLFIAARRNLLVKVHASVFLSTCFAFFSHPNLK
jgi:dolichyl-phosphate beta-glucosyltransferase